jgi:hypothetical protein
MGIQSVAVRHLRIAGVVTAFITGTITTAITEALSGGEHERQKGSTPALLVAMSAIYVAAAALTAAFAWTKVPQFAPLACVAAVRFRWRSGM